MRRDLMKCYNTAMKHSTISLIGMPGAGKSTIGVLLAKELGLSFVDTDLIIQVRHNASLQELLDDHGHLQLRYYEEEVLLDIPLAHTLVATGGSAVYSEAAMRRLRHAGPGDLHRSTPGHLVGPNR